MDKYEQILKEKKRIIDIFDIKGLRLIHFGSVENFLLYYNHLKSERDKDLIIELLTDYFKSVGEDPFITREKSQYLYFNYIEKIAPFYVNAFGFRRMPRLGGSIFIGLLADSFLYFIGILKFIFFIPVSTLYLLWYYSEMVRKYKRKNMVYGYQF